MKGTVLIAWLACSLSIAHAQNDPTITPDSAQGVSRDVSELSLDELLNNAARLRFALNFFGDVSATASSEDGRHPGFELGEPSLLVTADLGSGVRSLMEVAFGPEDSLVDVSQWSALKAEYRLEAPLESGHSTIHRALVNWSFGL